MTAYVFSTPFETIQQFAFVMGEIGDGRDVLVRLHRSNVAADVIGGGKQIDAVLTRFAAAGRGVLVYLRDGTAGVPLKSATDEGTEALRARQWREVGLGAQILRDLGVVSIRNLATSSRSYVGLSGFGIELPGGRAAGGLRPPSGAPRDRPDRGAGHDRGRAPVQPVDGRRAASG